MNCIKKFWPYLAVIALWLLLGLMMCSCNRALKKENERLRQELARQQKYVPLQRDTIRDTVEVITQKVVEVQHIKEVLSDEDKALLKDLHTKVSALDSYHTMGTATNASVTLSQDSTPERKEDSILVYKDAWLDLNYNQNTKGLQLQCHDSLAIAVEKEYKRRFLWWRWGVKGYQVKAVSFSPYSSIRYNTYVKVRK